ncbi:MAG: ATP-binding protein [Cyanobacteria bacterium J06642_11]
MNALNVLVVDDDLVDRMAIHRAIDRSALCANCDDASDGHEAIAAVRANNYDCAFLDYQLPDTDGLTLVKDIRNVGVNIPLIVLTGQGDEQIAVELMKAGASDYLSKSKLSPETLEQLVRNAVRIYEAERKTAHAYQKLHESNEMLKQQNRELEEQRRKIELQNIQLVEASRLKSEFLSTMSHELRTPLNAIIGFSQLLERQYPDPLTHDQLDMVNRILSNGKNLLALFNEVLDYSKIEASRLELTNEKFDIKQLVLTTVYELQSLAHNAGLELKVDTNIDDSVVFGDRHRVRQVLVNLLSNAIKFTEKGTVSVNLKQTGKKSIELAVCDTGIGIPKEKLSRIFDAFLQVDQTTSRRHDGTGLGLAIVHSLVEMMNGSITVESEVGEGSQFCITLPRELSAEALAAN